MICCVKSPPRKQSFPREKKRRTLYVQKTHSEALAMRAAVGHNDRSMSAPVGLCRRPSEPQFSSDAANTLMKNTKPAGFDNTTNPYGYAVGRPFAMVEKNELLYFETYGTSATGKIADVGTPESLKNFISKKGTASDASLPQYGHQCASDVLCVCPVRFL